jgi:hypothetical protein
MVRHGRRKVWLDRFEQVKELQQAGQTSIRSPSKPG